MSRGSFKPLHGFAVGEMNGTSRTSAGREVKGVEWYSILPGCLIGVCIFVIDMRFHVFAKIKKLMKTFIKSLALCGVMCLASADYVENWSIYTVACIVCLAVLVLPMPRFERKIKRWLKRRQ